jgi:CHAD domain-containing protein
MTTGRGPLATYLEAQVDAIQRGEGGVRAAEADPIHDTRVAVRRLRSTLRTFRHDVPRLSDGRVEALRDELAWFGGLLGTVRDRQVMAGNLATAFAAEPPEFMVGPVVARVSEVLAAQTADAHRELAAALDSERYRAMLTAADVTVRDVTEPDLATLRRRVDRTLRRARRRLAAARSGSDADRDVRLHEARKAYKRARYAVDVLRPVDGRQATRLAKRISAVQDVLGAHQDTVVLRQLLRELGMRAYLAGENSFTYGLLHARQAEAARREQAALPATAQRANRPRLRRWLAA